MMPEKRPPRVPVNQSATGDKKGGRWTPTLSRSRSRSPMPREKPSAKQQQKNTIEEKAREKQWGAIRLKHDVLSNAEKALIVLMFAKLDFQRTGVVQREAFAHWVAQEPPVVGALFDRAFPPSAKGEGINVIMWLAFCLQLEKGTGGYVSKKLAQHGALWHDESVDTAAAENTLERGTVFDGMIEKVNNLSALFSEPRRIFVFFRATKTKLARRGGFYWVFLDPTEEGVEEKLPDSETCFQELQADPTKGGCMGIHAMRTVYVGKTSRILGRLDLIGTAISPQRCFALVSRRGFGLYLVAETKSVQFTWLKGIEAVLRGRVQHEFSTSKVAVAGATSQPYLFTRHETDMPSRPIHLWFEDAQKRYMWRFADEPSDVQDSVQEERCIALMMLTDLYVGTNHEAFLNKPHGSLDDSCCFSLLSTKYNPARALHLESASPELAEAYIFTMKQFLAEVGRTARSRTLKELMSGRSLVSVVNALDTSTPAIQRIMRVSKMQIYEYGRQGNAVDIRSVGVWFNPDSGRYGMVCWNYLDDDGNLDQLQPRDDDPVESKSPRLSPQDQSISASLAFSTLGGHSSVVDDGHIAESHSSTSSSSTTRTSTRASRSTPHVSNPPDAMAAVKAFQSSERCQAVHTLQALIVGSANGVFPLLEHDDRSCFTLSGLFANVHLKAKDGKAAEDWRLGIKAALNAQFLGLSNTLTGIEVNSTGSIFVRHPPRSVEYESSVHSLVSSTSNSIASSASTSQNPDSEGHLHPGGGHSRSTSSQ